ncbi:MAG: preprotein translocase subunit SecY [Thermoplasmata archaeon]|nr:MAG: preprotein translocase subunit SecY [Thermoplasmata archaeon]
MAEEKGKSKLFVLKPIIERWPAVARPEGYVPFKTKLFWTVLCLVIYYILTQITIYGLRKDYIDMFAGFRAVMAGASGSLVHLGIGPIVTASIILQLFVGAKIINLDLTKSEDKMIYQGFQKILIIIMIFVEAIPQVFGYLQPDKAFIGEVGLGMARTLIILQLFMGALIVYLMDELISKWGIGSGVSLFIAAGVSEAIVTGLVNWLPSNSNLPLSVSNPPAGLIPGAYYIASHYTVGGLVERGFGEIFIFHPNSIVALLGTLTIFFFVVYAESSRIELPLAHGLARGARGRYPIRLIYASNIPVILMSALLANINMFALIFYTHPDIPLLGGKWWLGAYPPQHSRPTMGAVWYLSPLNGVTGWLLPMLGFRVTGDTHAPWQHALHFIIYLTLYIFGSILFAKFWIETTDMGPAAIARQIQQSDMHIPGFRRDPRILRKILERYIPAVTVIGGATVGALAAFADAIGTIGRTSGTGVLLMVGILIRLYEDLAREQAMDMHPVLRQFFGKG